MNNKRNQFGRLFLATSALLAAVPAVWSQPFAYQPNDLLLGFRKTGTHQANFELVVNIGQGSNYTRLSAGATLAVPNYTPTQLSNAFADFNFLNWSVLGNPDASLPGYPNNSIWLTVPRITVGTQTAAPTRLSSSAQQDISIDIASIFDGAVALSSSAGASNQNNNVVLIREPINDSYNLSTFVGGRFDAALSSLQDTWIQNVEQTTSASFGSAVRSDFYELRPNGFTDPHTGQTSGAAYYVGYFQLNTDGTMVFTRASASVTPPAPVLSVSRSGNTTTIAFGTTNGATYTLYYTNASGLKQPVTNWASSTTNITGNGSTNQFFDSTVTTNRFYRVAAH